MLSIRICQRIQKSITLLKLISTTFTFTIRFPTFKAGNLISKTKRKTRITWNLDNALYSMRISTREINLSLNAVLMKYWKINNIQHASFQLNFGNSISKSRFLKSKHKFFLMFFTVLNVFLCLIKKFLAWMKINIISLKIIFAKMKEYLLNNFN